MGATPWYIEPEQQQQYEAWAAALKGSSATALHERTVDLAGVCPAFLLQNYTRILDKDFALVPFRPWTPPQVKLYRVVRNLVRLRRPVRIVIVKPRQTGISTLTEGLAYHHAGHQDNHRVLIMAQEEDPALLNIYAMLQRFHQNVPEALRPVTIRDSLDLTEFKNGSKVSHKTAALGSTRKRSAGKGRGATYSFLHGSEVAYWPVPDRFFQGIEDGVPDRPGTFIFLESTANGHGDWFHRKFKRAARGWRMVKDDTGVLRWRQTQRFPTMWVPFFISWLEQPEYAVPIPGGAEPRERAYYLTHLDQAERRLLEEFGATLEQIEWRRYQIDKKDGDVEGFQREYPAEPEEAFVFSGNRVFDLGAMTSYLDVARQRDADSPPERGHLMSAR